MKPGVAVRLSVPEQKVHHSHLLEVEMSNCRLLIWVMPYVKVELPALRIEVGQHSQPQS